MSKCISEQDLAEVSPCEQEIEQLTSAPVQGMNRGILMDSSTLECDRCGGSVDARQICIVDGAHICNRCMYGDVKPFEIYPIGVVRNEQERASPGFGLADRSTQSRIELLPTQAAFLYKIEEETSLTIVYYLHEARSVRSLFHRGLDGKEVGVFASRTPDRLSKIAIQEVTLAKVEGSTLYVEGLDAIDGSPVLDIKLGRRAINMNRN